MKIRENRQIAHLLKQNRVLEEKYNNLKARLVKTKTANENNYDLINIAFDQARNNNSNSIKEENNQYTYESMVEAYKNADYSSFMVSEFM